MSATSTNGADPGFQPPRPQILLVSLHFEPCHDEMFSRLIDMMHDRAQIKRVRSSGAVLRFLTDNNPQAIIATDEGIAQPRNVAVLDRLVEYARNGGTVVLGLMFPSLVNFKTMHPTFARFGLPWKRGGYERSTFALNQDAIRHMDGLNLLLAYSQKALRLMNVERQNSLYIATSESVVESMVFAPRPVNRDEAPIAWGKVGEGHLGYIGDVNGQEGSDYVVMAMCGL